VDWLSRAVEQWAVGLALGYGDIRAELNAIATLTMCRLRNG
jgi:hypothetical protein